MAFRVIGFSGSFKLLIFFMVIGFFLGYFALYGMNHKGINLTDIVLLVLSGLPIYYWLYKCNN